MARSYSQYFSFIIYIISFFFNINIISAAELRYVVSQLNCSSINDALVKTIGPNIKQLQFFNTNYFGISANDWNSDIYKLFVQRTNECFKQKQLLPPLNDFDTIDTLLLQIKFGALEKLEKNRKLSAISAEQRETDLRVKRQKEIDEIETLFRKESAKSSPSLDLIDEIRLAIVNSKYLNSDEKRDFDSRVENIIRDEKAASLVWEADRQARIARGDEQKAELEDLRKRREEREASLKAEAERQSALAQERKLAEAQLDRELSVCVPLENLKIKLKTRIDNLSREQTKLRELPASSLVVNGNQKICQIYIETISILTEFHNASLECVNSEVRKSREKAENYAQNIILFRQQAEQVGCN